MKTTVIESQNAKNNKSIINNNRTNITGKEAKNEKQNDEAKNGDPQNEAGPQAGNKEVKADSSIAVDNQPGNVGGETEAGQIKQGEEAQPQGEPTKKEIKEH